MLGNEISIFLEYLAQSNKRYSASVRNAKFTASYVIRRQRIRIGLSLCKIFTYLFYIRMFLKNILYSLIHIFFLFQINFTTLNSHLQRSTDFYLTISSSIIRILWRNTPSVHLTFMVLCVSP